MQFTPTQSEIMNWWLENELTEVLVNFNTSSLILEKTYLSDLINEELPSGSVTDWEFTVFSELVIDVPYNFNDCIFTFGHEGLISVEEGTEVTFKDDTRLRACTDTWYGIRNYGSIVLEDVALSDAEFGVYNFNTGTLTSTSSTYLNNKTAIHMEDATVGSFSGNMMTTDDSIEFEVDETVGIRVLGNGSTTSINLSGEDENRFEQLGNGIIADRAAIIVKNSTFEKIGSRIINERKYAIRVSNIFVPSLISECSIIDCSHGIRSDNSIVSVLNNDRLDVYSYAVRLEHGGGAIISDNPTIWSRREAVSARNAWWFSMSSNGVFVDNFFDSSAATGVYVEQSGFTRIFDNSIFVSNAFSGIQIVLDQSAIIQDNTITIPSSNSTRGVSIQGMSHQHINCNVITSTINIDNSIAIELSNAMYNEIGCNQFSGVEDALTFLSTSPIHTIVANEFQGGDRGLVTDAILSMTPQSFLGNRWTTNYNEVDASSSLSLDINNDMQFEVNGDEASEFFPNNIDASGEWFADKAGINQTCENNLSIQCDGDIGSNVSSPIDQLNLYCEYLMSQDSLSCKEQWIKDYQVFSMIKDMGPTQDLTATPCLDNFMQQADSTTMQIFYTIDSLFNNINSTLRKELDDSFRGPSNVDQDVIEWITIAYLLTQEQTSKDNQINISINELDSVHLDSCNIVSIWSEIYSDYLLSLIDTTHQVDLIVMDNYARLCPEEGGQAVFLARSIMSQHSPIRYDLVQQCGGNDVLPRSSKSLIEDQNMLLYPNPTNGKFKIEGMSNGEKLISINSIDGRVLFELETRKTTKNVDLRLESGLYIVCVLNKTNHQKEVQKLFIN